MAAKEREVLEEIKEARLGVVSSLDVAKLLGKKINYAYLFVSRLKKRGLIQKVAGGKYALPETSPFVVASNLVQPSYISFLSGLQYHGLTTQIPRAIQIASSRARRSLEYAGYEILFVKLARKRMFGYGKEALLGGYAFVGDVEKTIIDSLFLPRHCPMRETFNAIKIALDAGKVDGEKIIEYVEKMDSLVAAKRLGFLLELGGMNLYKELGRKMPSKYELLNPLKPAKGERNKKWKLIVNEFLE